MLSPDEFIECYPPSLYHVQASLEPFMDGSSFVTHLHAANARGAVMPITIPDNEGTPVTGPQVQQWIEYLFEGYVVKWLPCHIGITRGHYH